MKLGDKVPNKSEAETVGAATSKIKKDTPECAALVKNTNGDIVFKEKNVTPMPFMLSPFVLDILL